MRTLTLAPVAAASLMSAGVVTGASAAGPGALAVQPPQAAALQQAQYYPRYLHRWGYPRYHHRRWWRGYDRWRYSHAEQLNRQELQRLGVAP